MARKSRFQDDDLTYAQVLARMEPWLRLEVGDQEGPLVQVASQHLLGGKCPPKCSVCGVCHVVVHCHVAQGTEAAYSLAELLAITREELQQARERVTVQYRAYREALLPARLPSLPLDASAADLVLPGEDKRDRVAHLIETSTRVLGEAVEVLRQAGEDVLGRTVTPSLADPAAPRRPAFVRTVVEAYLSRDGWQAADVYQLLQHEKPDHSALKRMYERARQAKRRGDISLMTLRARQESDAQR